jgi:DNA-binding beta-propeller fold protein YncE
VSNSLSNTVSVIDPNTNTVIDTTVYVTDYAGGNMDAVTVGSLNA